MLSIFIINDEKYVDITFISNHCIDLMDLASTIHQASPHENVRRAINNSPYKILIFH